MLDRLADEADRIDVLDLAAGAERLARLSHRDVDVGAQAALLHVAVAGAEIAQDRAQLGEERLGLLRRAQVRLRHDLHQRHARAVEIDGAHVGMLVVQRFAGVLLQMQPLDADGDGLAVRHRHHDLALAHDRRFVLADLIALRQIGIEIVLPVEHRSLIDLGVQAQAGADRLADAFLVDHRQHAGHRGIDQRDVAVGLAAEFGRGAGKQLRVRGDLGVHLHADDDLPVAGCAFDEFRGFALHVHGDVLLPFKSRVIGGNVKAAPRSPCRSLREGRTIEKIGIRGLHMTSKFDCRDGRAAALRHGAFRRNQGSVHAGHRAGL